MESLFIKYKKDFATVSRDAGLNKSYVGNLVRGVKKILMDDSISRDEETDRTVVRVPDSENLVIVYNRCEEERRLDYKRQCLAEDGYELKPLAVIPEQGIILYSRCIGCRMNINGELESLEEGDFALFMDYLAE